MDLLHAALESQADIREVLVRTDLLRELPRELVERAKHSGDKGEGPDIGVCDQETLAYASALGGSADVIFTCAQPQWSLNDLALESGTTFFLDGVGDPGNVGTIIRSALAFGVLGVLCSPGTADPFGPKAMRGGMGSQFALPVVTEVAASDLRARLAAVNDKRGVVPQIWVAEPQGGEAAGTATSDTGVVVVLGAEREGVSGHWPGARRVTIAHGRVESLNVAMAGTIFAYESFRKERGAANSN
jgi:TrmH family RNA methyltransferase